MVPGASAAFFNIRGTLLYLLIPKKLHVLVFCAFSIKIIEYYITYSIPAILFVFVSSWHEIKS